MVQTVQGNLDARGLKFAIVLPRFNDVFGTRLLSGALDCLQRHGAGDDDILVVRVPGSFELPAAVARLQQAGKVDAVVALGVLIRGGTSHYEQIAAEVSRGLGEAARAAGPVVIYGVVTAESQEQAMERCGGKAGNRGWDAAMAAVEMARLASALDAGPKRGRRQGR
jgi:6,7-dimethyl-8-ribityllumazine synthase